MPSVQITFHPDTGQWEINPPVAILTATDQTITWSLNGGGIYNWAPSAGIEMLFDPPAPYTGWPQTASPTFNPMDNTYSVDLGTPNVGTSWIWYKWFFHVVDPAANELRIDPDIGNQPEGG